MRNYWTLSRSYTYSLLFAIPLLVLYELGTAYLGSEGEMLFRNGADVLLRALVAPTGIEGTLSFTLLLIGLALFFVFLERRRRKVRLRSAPFLGMALESVTYALLLGLVVGSLTHFLLQGLQWHLASDGGMLTTLPLKEAIVLSLGAGIYEEIVFRLLLVGGMFGIFRASGLEPRLAGIFSVILAALIFSGFHYIGPYGDPWALPSFLFRFLAGVVFSILFLLRGLGITAWTHALYDVFLVLALRS